MFEIYSKTDFQTVISEIFKSWKLYALPPLNEEKFEIKLMPFRKVGLHSLLTFMIFSDSKPIVVIKMPRYRDGKLAFEALRNEARALEHLAQTKIFKDHFPALFKLAEFNGVPVLLIRACDGEMLHRFIDREENLDNLKKYIENGADVLLKLNDWAKLSRKKIDDEFIKKELITPLKAVMPYYSQFTGEIEAFLGSFLENKSWLGAEYPVVYAHQEYNPWNILVEKNDNLVVLDWEDANPDGLPFQDLYNYFTVCFRVVFYGEAKHSQERPLEAKINRAESQLTAFNGFLNKYCQLLGVSPGLKDLFYVIFAVKQALFFVEEKRREINYGLTWLTLILNAAPSNCFESHIRNEIEAYKKINNG